MPDSQQPHELSRGDPHAVGERDVVFDCPGCGKSLVVDRVAEGHTLNCPSCGRPVTVPRAHRVVSLEEAPETRGLRERPEREQEKTALEAALRENRHQREEAGNQYRHFVSEANRSKLRIEKLDARIHELETRLGKL